MSFFATQPHPEEIPEMHSIVSRIAIAIFLVAGFGPTTQLSAEVILPDLPEGSLYQLIFATAGQRDATSTEIANYNAFVTQQAALSSKLPQATWYAVASTSAVDARDNAVTYTDVPIYNTRGELIAGGIGSTMERLNSESGRLRSIWSPANYFRVDIHIYGK